MKNRYYFYLVIFLLPGCIMGMDSKIDTYKNKNLSKNYIPALSDNSTDYMVKPLVCNNFLTSLSSRFAKRCDNFFDRLENPEKREDIKIIQMGRDVGLFAGSLFSGMLVARFTKKIDAVSPVILVSGIIGGCLGVGCQIKLRKETIKNFKGKYRIKKKQLQIEPKENGSLLVYNPANIHKKFAFHERELFDTSSDDGLMSSDLYPTNNVVITRDDALKKKRLSEYFDEMSIIDITEKK